MPTLAATVTAPYSDGQTWTRRDEDGDRVHLRDELDGTVLVYRRPETLHTSELEVREFADGSLIALCGDFWDLVAESGDGWRTCDNDGEVNPKIGEFYAR